MTPARRKLLFLVTEDWYFWLHWANLARAARDAGWDIVVAARPQDHVARIKQEGFSFVPLRLARGSMNPLREAAALLELIDVYRRERPDVAHHIALKPVLYGSVAARLAGLGAWVNSFPGVGHLFISSGPRPTLLREAILPMLRRVLRDPRSRTVFQNKEDLSLILGSDPRLRLTAKVVPGVGLDLARFVASIEPGGPPRVLLAGRLLREKGLREFVEAARLLARRGVPARFILAGRLDEENPSGVRARDIEAWAKEGVVEWVGNSEDMPALIASVHIVALPSYREGLPTILLEAGACGRPAVASDVPGCRDVVAHGESGLLVPARNASALAEAVASLAGDAALRRRMGRAGRRRVEAEFSLPRIAAETLGIYDELAPREHKAPEDRG